MKTIFPVAMAVIFGASLFTSCTKNGNADASSNICICAYKTVKGTDSTELGYYGYGPIFSAGGAAKQCALEQDTLRQTYPDVICSIENTQ